MLLLPNVTLICVATRDVPQARSAIVKSCQGIKFGEIKLLSNDAIIDSELAIMWHLGHSEVAIPTFEKIDDWNRFIFYDLYKYVDTEYCLLIHPDGYVINPDSWNPEWLNYDYIGAPWYDNLHHDVFGNVIRVGNNSVSIRSKRLLELPSKLNLEWVNENEDLVNKKRKELWDDTLNALYKMRSNKESELSVLNQRIDMMIGVEQAKGRVERLKRWEEHIDDRE